MPERREIVARVFGEGPFCDDEGACEGDDGLRFEFVVWDDLSLSDGRRVRVRELGVMRLARWERRPMVEVSILVVLISCLI